jgi:DNA-binding CsgD family transcriptional regulator
MKDGTPVGGRPARHGPRDGPATHDAAISRATDREVIVVAAVLAAGSEKAAAHRLGLSHSTVKHHLANARSKVGATTPQLAWTLAPWLPEPDRERRRATRC